MEGCSLPIMKYQKALMSLLPGWQAILSAKGISIHMVQIFLRELFWVCSKMF